MHVSFCTLAANAIATYVNGNVHATPASTPLGQLDVVESLVTQPSEEPPMMNEKIIAIEGLNSIVRPAVRRCHMASTLTGVFTARIITCVCVCTREGVREATQRSEVGNR